MRIRPMPGPSSWAAITIKDLRSVCRPRTPSFKTPTFVIHSLIDIVSRNGNLLLSIPLRGDGTLDEDEHAFLTGLASWM